ncbi:MAG: hypothetical protein FWE05_02875 [Defluviitaleaceae bacterium]|nr:hypothetical protein [Defluviitaleaceae bacterium]
MPKETISFTQFMEAVEADNKIFIQALHDFLMEKSCKLTIEEKKSGFMASYKYNKKSIINFLFRKTGMLVRVYGENASKYPHFLDTLPEEMTQHIKDWGICKRLVHNTCNSRCAGYEFMLDNAFMQKCKYGCFDFHVTEGNNPYIQSFIEHEIKERG